MRYSQLYVERGQRVGDSPQARRRIIAWFSAQYEFLHTQLYDLLKIELGEKLPGSSYQDSLERFFEHAPRIKFLDGITVVSYILGTSKGHFIEFAQRVFIEENLDYIVDDAG